MSGRACLVLACGLLAACTPQEKSTIQRDLCIPTRSCDCVHCEGMKIK